MSRLIVKNLPNTITVEKLKEIFSEKGQVTDVQLKYTRQGKFRNFGFVGYKSEQQATEAKDYFNNTCINSVQITVEPCAALGDTTKPRAWSKYAADSTAYKKLHKDEIEVQESEDKKLKKKVKKKKSDKDRMKKLLEKYKDDSMFTEFIEAHVNEKTIWIKEALETIKNKADSDSGVDEADLDESMQGNEKQSSVAEGSNTKKEKMADKNISDFEYMKILMKKAGGSLDEKSNEVLKEEPQAEKKIRKRPLFHVKINKLPYKCKKRDIKDLFRPLVPYSIRFPLGKGKKLAGFCFVGFRTEAELKKALLKDKLFVGSHRVNVVKHDENKNESSNSGGQGSDRKRQEESIENEDSIGESGKIFVRNLAYCTTEQDLTELFEKYGPIAEMNMPIDKVLRQPKGFATITFMLPEHAAKAYSELDGTVFCGRMLHLLPGKQNEKGSTEDNENLSFKEKKTLKLKSQAKSSHNWNTLFLGANAVADVVADVYNTTKEHLLTDNSKKTSAAVRLALGETQIVAETKQFLEDNGVFLDAFNEAPKKRSKTCILVKNLPANTTKEELQPLFLKHGPIARFVMPKHGITALIDFIEPSEAKNAFTKLAYSMFKSTPLYLEWAPENVFLNAKQVDKDAILKEITTTDDSTEKSEEFNYSDNKSLLNKHVIKDKPKIEDICESVEEAELNTTLFVKNLNFKTTDDSLREHFTQCGKLKSAAVARKKDPKTPGATLSMGYGFVQYFKKRHADKALKELQNSILDEKTLELKRSERGNSTEVQTSKKSANKSEQRGTKILVRNIPFQANRNEIHEIFRAFGEIKSLRLPKKLTQGEDQHRGFCFVDFHTKSDAKSAFDALSQSTHLYGRRMVLEWAQQEDESEDIDSLRKRTTESYNASAPGGKRSKKAEIDVETFVDN